MPQLSDLCPDSPLALISVRWLSLGWFERLGVSPMLAAMGIKKFCCHRGVFGFHDPRSIHNLSSYTRSCSQTHRSPYFSASSNLWHTGVTAIIKLSLEPPERHSLSAASFTLAAGEPGVNVNTVAQLFATALGNPRRIVRDSNDARVCLLSAVKRRDQRLSCARVDCYITYRSLKSPSLLVSDRAGHRRPESRTPQRHVTRTGTTSVEGLLRKSAATLGSLFWGEPLR